MRYTNKKIYIFNEMLGWQAENIMNDTIYSKKLNKFIQFDKIKIEDTTEGELNKPAWGKLWQYTNHSTESIIFLKINSIYLLFYDVNVLVFKIFITKGVSVIYEAIKRGIRYCI